MRMKTCLCPPVSTYNLLYLVMIVILSFQHGVIVDYRNVQGVSSSIITFSITRCAVGLVPAACAFVGAVVTFTMQLEKPAPKPLMDPLLS